MEESETKLLTVHHVWMKIALDFSGVSLVLLLCVSASACVAAGLHCTVHVSDWSPSSSSLEDDQLGATRSAREPKPTANKHVRIRTLTRWAAEC